MTGARICARIADALLSARLIATAPTAEARGGAVQQTIAALKRALDEARKMEAQ